MNVKTPWLFFFKAKIWFSARICPSHAFVLYHNIIGNQKASVYRPYMLMMERQSFRIKTASRKTGLSPPAPPPVV